MESLMYTSITRQVLGVITAVVAAVALVIGIAIPAGAMTVTFVRHGESEGNASGLIDTKTPGPPLTALGVTQANDVAAILDPNSYDAVFASTMLRTQQTATPFAAKKYQGGDQAAVTISTDPYHPVPADITVLNGLQEISAGIFEGSPEDSGIGRIGYILAPLMWTLGLRFMRIPGSEDGNEFEARVNGALDQIGDGGSDDPLVFSHGATIMFWTMMNVDNPDLSLLVSHPLDNTDVVVVESNGEGGWTLKSWAGINVAPASFGTQMFVNVRDLIVAPQTALYNLRAPILALDIPGIVTGVQQGVSDVAAATRTFVVRTVQDVAAALRGLVPNAQNARASSSAAADPATDVAKATKTATIGVADTVSSTPKAATVAALGKAAPRNSKAGARNGQRSAQSAAGQAADSVSKSTGSKGTAPKARSGKSAKNAA
jgi:broad specificity phosphatase PhoE